MFNAEDDIIPKLEASCTKAEAVAKMLGWLQGPYSAEFQVAYE